MPPRRAGRPANARVNRVANALVVGQDQPPVVAQPAQAAQADEAAQAANAAHAAEITANRTEMQELRNMMRCTSLVELVEEAARLEIGLVEEAMDLKKAQAKVTKGAESQKRTWDNRGAVPVQNGKDNNCRRCGKPGHFARDCRVNLAGGQPGNQNRGIMPPPPKRQAVGPRVYAIAGEEDVDEDGADPIVGSVLVGGVKAYTMFDSGATHCFVSPELARCWDSTIE
ncbi:unnamed protein product [Arabidopsis thaliana]|uniref:(thale cress) hypothetical protein n=1 Tax=Arabidopsis thaliana TaxID=3702 RepID=A0A7G2FF90_ARATH|nr:unnamed protein product [Arabidopsis thaliana]